MLRKALSLTLCIALLLTVAACTVQTVPAATESAASSDQSAGAGPAVTIDLDAVKAYAMENAELMQAATFELVDVAQEYCDHVQQASKDNADPYAKLWAENQAEIQELVVQARDLWLEAST